MWIVAVTKPKAEHLAKANLERQGYEAYLPLVTISDQLEVTPMFPGYILVNTEPMEGMWRPINSTRGISGRGVLKTGDHPSLVPQRVIDTLQRREEAGVIRLKRRAAVQDLQPGQAVRVHEGHFAGFEGVFERRSGQDRVYILLSYVGRHFPVELPAEAVA